MGALLAIRTFWRMRVCLCPISKVCRYHYVIGSDVVRARVARYLKEGTFSMVKCMKLKLARVILSVAQLYRSKHILRAHSL